MRKEYKVTTLDGTNQQEFIFEADRMRTYGLWLFLEDYNSRTEEYAVTGVFSANTLMGVEVQEPEEDENDGDEKEQPLSKFFGRTA